MQFGGAGLMTWMLTEGARADAPPAPLARLTSRPPRLIRLVDVHHLLHRRLRLAHRPDVLPADLPAQPALAHCLHVPHVVDGWHHVHHVRPSPRSPHPRRRPADAACPHSPLAARRRPGATPRGGKVLAGSRRLERLSRRHTGTLRAACPPSSSRPSPSPPSSSLLSRSSPSVRRAPKHRVQPHPSPHRSGPHRCSPLRPVPSCCAVERASDPREFPPGRCRLARHACVPTSPRPAPPSRPLRLRRSQHTCDRGRTVALAESKWDFSFLGVGLMVALVGFITWGFFASLAFPSFMFSQAERAPSRARAPSSRSRGCSSAHTQQSAPLRWLFCSALRRLVKPSTQSPSDSLRSQACIQCRLPFSAVRDPVLCPTPIPLAPPPETVSAFRDTHMTKPLTLTASANPSPR